MSQCLKVLNKLTGSQLEVLSHMKKEIHNLRVAGNRVETARVSGKVHGYLTALVDLGWITDRDRMLLAIYFIG